mmetsp:Transcript_10688/g.45528  ORF Transcript_10688/g.45528 Transcript_10688/m.45528 type:complete len:278 (+) Transcript_10688:1381-2214(+)
MVRFSDASPPAPIPPAPPPPTDPPETYAGGSTPCGYRIFITASRLAPTSTDPSGLNLRCFIQASPTSAATSSSIFSTRPSGYDLVTTRFNTSFLPGGTVEGPTFVGAAPGAACAPSLPASIMARISSSSRRSSSSSGALPLVSSSMAPSSSSASESGSDSDSESSSSLPSSSSSLSSSSSEDPASWRWNARRPRCLLSCRSRRTRLKILFAASRCSVICCWMPTRSDRAKRDKPLCSALLSAVAAPESSRIKPMRFQRCRDLIWLIATPNPVRMRSV